MSKTKKRAIRTARNASRSRSFVLLLVMAITVLLGAATLPRIFADTTSPIVTGVAATPSNNDKYAITVTWSGRTNDHWKGRTTANGVTTSWTSQDKSITFNGLVCNVTYNFEVAAAGPGNGAQSDWKSAVATPPCPQVIWSSFAANGNNVGMSWVATMPRFNSTFNLYIKAGGGAYARSTTTGTSWTISGICNTTYTVYATATAGGQTGPASAIKSATTAGCPPTPSGGGGSSGGGSSSGGGGASGGSTGSTSGSNTSGGGSSKSNTSKSSSSSSSSKPGAPGMPANFSADVVSSKIVNLSWNEDTAVDHYVLSRTGDDGATWQELSAAVKGHTYTDEETDFSATYTYRLQAVGSTGLTSPLATVQVSTEAFKASSNQINSDDNLIHVAIPADAIDGEYNCSVDSDEESAGKLPADLGVLLGPVALNCVNTSGEVIDSFNKPLTVTMKLSSVAEGYSDISAGVYQNGAWKSTKYTYDASKQILTFNIDQAIAFAAFGQKQHSAWGTVFVVLLILLLLGGGLAAYFLWWRRRNGDNYYPPVDLPVPGADDITSTSPAISAAAQNELNAEQEFRQAVAQPDCSHLSMAQQVVPSGVGCYECEQQGTKWRALRICLICGHVGCSDDSPQQHALKHYQETGHPLIYEYGNPAGNTIGWCYVDQTYI